MNDSIKKTETKPKRKFDFKLFASILAILILFMGFGVAMSFIVPSKPVEKNPNNISELSNAKAGPATYIAIGGALVLPAIIMSVYFFVSIKISNLKQLEIDQKKTCKNRNKKENSKN